MKVVQSIVCTVAVEVQGIEDIPAHIHVSRFIEIITKFIFHLYQELTTGTRSTAKPFSHVKVKIMHLHLHVTYMYKVTCTCGVHVHASRDTVHVHVVEC